MVQRYFTVDEANALIPRLEQVIRTLQESIRRARENRREMEMIKAIGYGEDGNLIMQVDYDAAKACFQEAVRETNQRIADVQSEGCQLKDIEKGLVDFPAIIRGNEVLLCWELGEPKIEYFHHWYSGYGGRQPLDHL